MKTLTKTELFAVFGGLYVNDTPTSFAAGFALVGLALLGAQRVAIDALKPYCKSITNVDSFSLFLGDKFGTKEHFSHILTSVLAVGAVAGLINET